MNVVYRSYLRELEQEDLSFADREEILADAAEDPFLSRAEYEGLWFVFRHITGGEGL